MNLNRNNYEEYFILYLDNELGEAERRKVEEFIERNPDLKDEFETLSHFKLIPEQISFPGKINLLKTEAGEAVQTGNYEELVLSYIDNELGAEEKARLETFFEQDPAARKELELYSQTKIPVESVSHPDKSSLYRHEVKKINPAWWRVAAAAILILAAGGYFISRTGIGNNANPGQPSANNNQPSVTKELAKQPAKTDALPVTVQEPEVRQIAVVKKTEPKLKEKNNNQVLQVKEEKKQSETMAAIRANNNLPQPLYNPNVTNNNTGIASIKNTLTNSEEIKPVSVVTPGVIQTLHNETSSADDDVAFNEQGGKKSKLRGLLRKVTRTFEKTTNISATDDEDRLLIGGLAIKLK